jgi:hypothetical protein
MVSPDSLIPDPYNTLDYSRFDYARSNPLKYTDPSRHTPVCIMGNTKNGCIQWAGLAVTGSSDAAGFEGLDNDTQAQIAWNMMDLGIYKDEQKAMEYIVGTEFNSAILNVTTKNSEVNYLFEAMTRRYHEFCSGGSWTGDCLSGFWGYHQGPLTGAGMPDYTQNELAKIGNIASAIIEPGKDFNGVMADSTWNGCGNGPCHYAQARSGLSGWVKNSGFGVSSPDGTYSINNPPVPGWLLYMYPHGGSDYFVIMNQAMWNWLNVNHSDYLWNGN